jgi:hypothetical protein
MGKTNFTFLFGLVAIAMSWMGLNTASAQCNPPHTMTVVSVTETTATLRWTSPNTPIVDHCWTLEVGAVGFSCGNGQQVVETTICTNSPGVTWNNATGVVTYTVGGLQPGTSYDWTLVETCDGIPGTNSGPCSNAQGPVIVTLDAQFQVSATTVRPTCPEVSPGYVPDGSFTVTVVDGVTCAGTYTIQALPVANSSPLGNTPPFTTVVAYIGFGQGNFLFDNAGAGQYTVIVTETGPCNPPTDPVVIIVTVPDGIDNQAPIWYITDVLGNTIVDNDPLTAAPSSLTVSTPGNPLVLPEGECGYQQQLYAFGFDNCDGAIVNPAAVTSTAVTTPNTINPGTQVNVVADGFGNYLIDIHWSIGNTVLTSRMFDAAGNSTPLTITAFVEDNVNPSIAGPAQNYTIPFCETTISPIFGFTINDGCDEFINDASLTVTITGFPGATVTRFFPAVGTQNGYVEYRLNNLTAGSGFLTITYTDFFGNSTFIQPEITVQQAGQDLDPVIDAPGNLTYHVPSCQATSLAFGSFQIWDDCDDINPALVVFNNGGTGFNITFTNVDNDNNSAYFEYSGNIAPGIYLMSVSYQGTFIDWIVNVTQDAPQAPDIIMPGNLNFTIPVCQPGVTTTFSITITDECDDPINAANADFFFNGVALTPTFINAAAGYFEFTETFTPADNGGLLLASYTDGDGLTTTVDALITVTDQPDNWAPIIIYPANDLNFVLDPCDIGGVALAFFEVTATDNCDGDITPTVTVAPPAVGAFILPSPGGDTYLLVAGPGSYQILIEATDAAGNTRQEDFFVVVTQDPAPETNLACNPLINVTLNDDCQVLVIPDMVLEGNPGCLEDDDFELEIHDGNPANGNVVDGCGDFIYEISLAVTSAPISGFNGPFAPGNWAVSVPAPQFGGGVNFSGNTLTINGPDGAACFPGQTASAAIAIPEDGTVSFNWNFVHFDIFFDFFVVRVTAGGVVTTVVNQTGSNSGVVNLALSAGDVLFLGVTSSDCILGAGTATITNFSFIPAVTGPDGGDFTTCWGYIHAEDKTAPVINCPNNTSQAMVTRDVQFVNGALETTDPQLVLTDYSCFLGGFFLPAAGNHYYDLFTFTVSQADVYTFLVSSAWGDAGMVLYQGDFDPTNPCQNVIGATDDVNIFVSGNQGFAFGGALSFDPIYRVNLPLQPNKTYTLLTTSWPANTTGNYTWAVYSDGNGIINGLPVQQEMVNFDLICDDLDHISLSSLPVEVPRCYRTDRDGNVILPTNAVERARVQQLLTLLGYTGFPNANAVTAKGGSVSDNCGNLEICVTETITENGDCGLVTVNRTFTVKDKQGNYVTNSPCAGQPNTASCTQTITVRKPTGADLNWPPQTGIIECDEGFAVDANGNPSPTVTGRPFILTAFGFQDIDPTYCNFAATYEDGPVIDVCAGTYKFVRYWTVINWCNPSPPLQHEQVIKVGDNTPPSVECPIMDWDGDGLPDGVLTYSTGPFNCTAAFAVPAPTISDNCSPTATIVAQVVTDVVHDVLDIYGNPTGQTTTETVIVATLDPVTVDLTNQPATLGFVSGIPPGCHRFRYTVKDACDKQTVIECDFYVEDQVEPIAVCDDQLNISIGGAGLARVYAEDIDEGSSDNCGPISIEVRRLVTEDPTTCAPVPPFYTPWGPYVDLNCCDVNSFVTIELRVWDDRNGDGIPGNTIPVVLCDGSTELVTDNSNVCWLDVYVEDKVRPFCIAPHNANIDCDDLPYDFDPFNTDQLQDLFGEAEATDNCPGAVWEELTPIVNLHDCGFGTIIRRFRAIDAVGNVSTNTCQQIVTINEVHNYEIKFPKDASAICGTVTPDTIEYNEIGCDLLAVSTTDEFFSASGDECYKIFRTFRVINWCEYDGQSAARVVGRDEDCDNNPGDEDIWVLRRPSGVVYYDRNNNENDNNPFPFTKSPACDGLTNPAGHWINSNIDQNATPPRDISSVGFWQYTQVIKVYDNIKPQITFDQTDPFCSINNVTCDAAVQVPFTIDENCTPDDLTIKVFLDAFADGVIDSQLPASAISGTYPNYVISGTFPIGEHAFEVHAEDGCGNANAVLIPFSVVDCKAPAPICINGLAIELMPVEPDTDADGDGDIDTGAAAVWATDFIASPITDCSEPIKYSINRAGETPNIDQDGLIVTCDDPATLIVEIYAWDSAFNPYAVQPDGTVGGPNYDFCETYILVQDNMFNLCQGPGAGSIAGAIATEQTNPVEGVEVNLSGQMSNMQLTDGNGMYLFNGLEIDYDYTITPQLDVNPLNGVSTFDLVLISKHILGVQPLGSPYKMIAADINNSQTITTLDLIQARKLILAIETDFPNNTSWRFVDASYVFPVPTNPWFEAFPEVININDLPANAVIGQDFIAVKIGDVNGSAQTSSLITLDERNTAGTFAFDVADQAVRMGNEYTVTFRADEIASIQGYQLTLNFDAGALELLDIEYGAATAEHFGLRFVDEGMITMSWNGEATAKDELFSLVFRANADAQLSDLLSVSSRYTMAEAYNTGDQLLDVAINFSSGAVSAAGFELYQNTPNPFKGETQIGFSLPQDANVTITIHDVTGKVLKLMRGNFAKGYNVISVNSSELPASGVLYYTVATAEHTATKKMIIVE